MKKILLIGVLLLSVNPKISNAQIVIAPKNPDGASITPYSVRANTFILTDGSVSISAVIASGLWRVLGGLYATAIVLDNGGVAAATTGMVRIPNNSGGIKAINFVGSQNITLADVDASDVLNIGSAAASTILFRSAATQLRTTQTTPPTCTTNCGSSVPAVAGTDTAGIITLGTTPASGFVLLFNGTWAAAPSCTVNMATAGMVVGKMPLTVVTTTGQFTVVTNGTAPATADKYSYHCLGVQ